MPHRLFPGGWMDGWMDGWKEGRMDGWVSGWMDGRKGGGREWVRACIHTRERHLMVPPTRNQVPRAPNPDLPPNFQVLPGVPILHQTPSKCETELMSFQVPHGLSKT